MCLQNLWISSGRARLRLSAFIHSRGLVCCWRTINMPIKCLITFPGKRVFFNHDISIKLIMLVTVYFNRLRTENRKQARQQCTEPIVFHGLFIAGCLCSNSFITSHYLVRLSTDMSHEICQRSTTLWSCTLMQYGKRTISATTKFSCFSACGTSLLRMKIM